MMDKPCEVTERQIAEWLMATMRMFGAEESTCHKVTGIFLEAIDTGTSPTSEAAVK